MQSKQRQRSIEMSSDTARDQEQYLMSVMLASSRGVEQVGASLDTGNNEEKPQAES
jgi:hypothetical protein